MGKLYSEHLSELPVEFNQFIEMCDGLDFDIKGADIDIKEEYVDDYETRIEIQLVPKETKSLLEHEQEISFSYTSEIDIDSLKADLERIRNVIFEGKEAFVEKFVSRDFSIGKYDYDYFISEYMSRNDCEMTKENIFKALSEEAEYIYETDVIDLSRYEERYRDLSGKSVPCDIEGVINMPGFTFAILESNITGGILPSTGGIILFTTTFDENKKIDTINFNAYDDISKVAYVSDDEMLINYNRVNETIEELELKGIHPTASECINYSQMLGENGLRDMERKPVGAIFQLKDVLTEKYLGSTSAKGY